MTGRVPEDCDASKTEAEPEPIPALFATIHFRSPTRPTGYTDDEIRAINEQLNRPKGEVGTKSK